MWRPMVFPILAALAACPSGLVLAEEAPISRADAVSLGALRGPPIAVEQAPRAAAEEARRQANPVLVMPPRFTVEGGQRFGLFGSGLETRLQLVQDIPLRAVGRERERAAALLVRSTDANVGLARLEAATRAGIAWAGVLEAQQVLELRRRSLAEADELVRLARARVGQGVSLPIDLQQALGERGAAAALVLDAEGRLVEARAELRFATGLDAAAPVQAVGELLSVSDPAIDEEAAIRRALEAHPALRASRARAEVARQEELVVRAARAPVLSVGAAYLREGSMDQVVTAIVGVPLPFGDFGGFDRARQRAHADQAEAAIRLTRQQLARDVRMALHERLHAREVLVALTGGARAPLSEALRLTQAQYQAGAEALSLVLIARQRLLDAEERILRAAAEVQRADLRLGRAAGTLLEGANP